MTSRVGANPDADLFKQFGIGGYNPTTAYTANGGLPSFVRQRIYRIRRRPMGTHSGIQQRLGFCAERCHQQGLSRNQVRRGVPQVKFPFFQVPAPHGIVNYSANKPPFPRRRRRRWDRRSAASTGRCDRFRAARAGGQRFDFDDELHLVPESRMGRLCAG